MPAPAGTFTPTTIALWAAAAWAAWHGVVFTWTGEARHRAESAWLIFAAVLLIAGFSAWRSSRPAPELPPPSPAPWWAGVAGFIGISVVLYYRALALGLLSDDFVLLDRVERQSLVDPAWDYLRPLPLLVWWVASWFDGPAALHLINVVMHGVNAWLVVRVETRLGVDRRVAELAGLIFLTWPTQMEAVAWASGVFDVMMTSFVLLSVLNVFDDRRSDATRIGRGAALAVAAIACKETAVALPILLAALWPMMSGATRIAAIRVTAASALIAAGYVAMRLTGGVDLPADAAPTGYQLKEALSRPFGAIAMNFHVETARAVPALPAAIAVAWPALLALSAASWQRRSWPFRLLLSAALWLLASVAPLMTTFFVADDLQQSRYLYLGSTLWAIALTALVMPPASPRRTLAVFLLVGLNVGLVLTQGHRWREAADLRDRVVRAYLDQAIECDPNRATGLPDNVGGAYVFRNGFPEAIARAQPGAREWKPCRARWDGVRFVVE